MVKTSELSSVQSRSRFLLLGSSALIAGCAGGVSSTPKPQLLRSSSAVTPDLCIAGQPNCGRPPPTPPPRITVGTVTAPRTSTYGGGVFKSSSGQNFGSIDANGASVNSVRTSGVLTINAYKLASQNITSSHPLFQNQPFTMGTTSFTPRSQQAGLPMYRWSDATFGSGAVWIDSSGIYNVAFSGMGDTIAQGGHGSPVDAGTAPTACQEQGVGLTAIGLGAALGGLATGARALQGNPYAGSVSTLLNLLGIGTTLTGLTPCPATQSGDPTPSQILPIFNTGGVYAGDGMLPDGGGSGASGSDQLLYA